MFRSILLLMLVLFLLPSCAWLTDQGVMELVDETGKTIGKVTDAAVQRDLLYLKALENRDLKYKEMHAVAGMSIENELITLECKDGSKLAAYVPKTVEVRPIPNFQQRLETRPPDHRGWDSFDNVVNKATLGFFGWVVGNTYDNQNETPRYHFGGNYSVDSYNPYTVNNLP